MEKKNGSINNSMENDLIFDDQHWENVIEQFQNNSLEGEAAIHESIKFLSASKCSLQTLDNRSGWRQLLGKISGGNNNLREASIANLQRSQENVIRFLEKLSEQNLFLMDSVKLNQQAINYLNIELIEHQRYVNRVVQNMTNRIINIEQHFEKFVQTDNWKEDVPNLYEKLQGKTGSFELLLGLTENYFGVLTNTLPQKNTNELNQNILQWPDYIRTRYQGGLRNAGFSQIKNDARQDKKITLENLINEISVYFKKIYNNDKYNSYPYFQINKYPVPLLIGQNFTSTVIWEVDNMVHNESIDKIIQRIEDVHNIKRAKKIVWVDIGFELLYTKKQFHSISYIKHAMTSLMEDIVYKIIKIVPRKVKTKWIDDNRICSIDWEVYNICVGYKIEIMKSWRKAIEIFVQFIEEVTGNSKIRILIGYEGYVDYKGSIVSFYEQNREGKFNHERENWFEISVDFDSPNWQDWETLRELIAEKVLYHYNLINSGKVPGIFKIKKGVK